MREWAQQLASPTGLLTPATVIRRCEARDLDAFVRLGSEQHVAWCRERFARDDVVILVAADSEGNVSGKLHVEFGNSDDGTPQVVAAAVVASLRGRGIGTALVHAAESLARDRGHDVLTLGVEDDNPRARRLYERLGYEAYRTDDFVYLGAPVPNPGVWMRKELSC